ncbi:MAG: hypothetical protein DDT29_02477 [Dehalococcoidia bacterium]|nr:hypothetical protein [Bacillota bacterium]
MPSPEEMAKIEKQRTLSDTELLKVGADYKFDEKDEKRLDVTNEQIEKAREEMGQDKNKENIESPKIKFPEDITKVKSLQEKLAEYKERLGTQMKKDPHKVPELFTDTNYKIAVLEKLLTDGEVNTHELSRELNEKYGGFNVDDFNNACAVIEDYAKTGGKEVTGGTGLKFEQPPMPSPEEMAKIEKQRTLSDTELLKVGADYKFDEKDEKRLDVTNEQIEKAREEMGQDKNKENIESPKIKFPEDITKVKSLQEKLAEYKERLGTQMKKDPHKVPELFTDTNYKIAVLEKLLTDGEVNTHELSRELNEKYGGFNVDDFNNACAVIEDYAKTGGKEVTGGTGLKFEKKQEE